MSLSEPSSFHRRLVVAGAAALVAGIAVLPGCRQSGDAVQSPSLY